MNKNEHNELYIFGYGLALLIPFLILFHSFHLGRSFFSVAVLISGFAFIMYLIQKMTNVTPFLNLWVLLFQGGVFYRKVMSDREIVPFILLGLAFAILLMTVVRVESLSSLYKRWMMVAHGIGAVITSIVLGLLFYGVFGPVGIVLRLMKKDLLDERLDKDASSYWQKKEQKKFEKSDYEKQF